ncbi:MAG: hypothetical protein JWP97_6168 [Labilithrix sp.]|nr:hypothetical protein [Labilithrix sp.]
MRRSFFHAALAALLFVVAPLSANAAPPAKAQIRDLAVAAPMGVTLAPLQPPGPEHPEGTLAAAWYESEGADDGVVKAAAWDVATGRLGAVRTLVREKAVGGPTVQLLRTADALFVIRATSLDAAPIELLRVDLDLRVRDRVSLAEGSLASIAADGPYVAVASIEEAGYHVRLFDASSLAVIAARVIQGSGRLTAWPSAERSGRALRFERHRLLVALADPANPVFLGLRLPSLATELSGRFVTPRSARWYYTSASFVPAPGPLAVDIPDVGRRALSPTLQPAGSLPYVPDTRRSDGLETPEGAEASSAVMGGRRFTTGVREDGRWAVAITPDRAP